MLLALFSGIAVLTAMATAIGFLLSFALKRYPEEADTLVFAINRLLPQTQCAQCGHPGCKPYAKAIAAGEPINRCPPGGSATIAKLANLLGVDALPLDDTFGIEPADTIAVIREAECIGCTLCIQACPVDAIVGAAQHMHSVIENLCTGCDLCLEPCPVDCIDMMPVTNQPRALPSHLLKPLKRQMLHETGCIRCGACETACPQGLQPQALFWQGNDSGAMGDLALDRCIECMLCDRACPSHIPLTRAFAATKQRICLETAANAQAAASELRYKQRIERHNKQVSSVKSRANADDRAALLHRLKQARL